jgi:hypothetical protein
VAERLVLDGVEANEVRANPLGLVLLILFVIFYTCHGLSHPRILAGFERRNILLNQLNHLHAIGSRLLVPGLRLFDRRVVAVGRLGLIVYGRLNLLLLSQRNDFILKAPPDQRHILVDLYCLRILLL